jgi:hypothetical protein
MPSRYFDEEFENLSPDSAKRKRDREKSPRPGGQKIPRSWERGISGCRKGVFVSLSKFFRPF